ncbi:hypothetical protein K8Q98_00895 [Candidatus Nomurabacteria bacterium]|nr:hypothetical protein [Candidatus Nomurabacteria bacterium]
MVFNKEEIIRGVREATNIKDREVFVAHMLKVLDPIIVMRVTQARLFSKIERGKTINDAEHIKLSEVLYIGAGDLNNENDDIYFHLSSAEDFMTKEKIEDFKMELEKGLTKLAELIKPYPNLKTIWANSWIVAIPRSRKRLESFGFTFAGMTPVEETTEHFPNDTRPIAKAFITREELLSRYGNVQA